jgi:hypothetical protein
MALNTHTYDGKTDPELAAALRATCTPNCTVHAGELKAVLAEARKGNTDPKLAPAVERSLKLLENDARANWDASDSLNASCLLIECWKVLGPDKRYFYEQLADIQNGTCAQGRVKRLFQVFHALQQ